MKPEHPAKTHADTENVPTTQTVASLGWELKFCHRCYNETTLNKMTFKDIFMA